MGDITGILITENIELINKVQKYFKQGKDKITYEEFIKLKIFPQESSYKIGQNLKLSASFWTEDRLIKLIDEKKDGYGRWRSDYVDAKKVSLALEDFKLTKNFYKDNTETKLNEEIGKHLLKYFEKVQTQKGNRKGIFDIEIGEMDFVIEIKMASTIKTSKHGASGQINQYLKGFDSNKFMLLIAGERNEEERPHIQALIEECKKDFRCHWDYLYAE